MDMTFDQYISNPMGKKNAVYGNREMFRELYKTKLDTILVREIGKVKYNLYKSKKGRYYVHFKIPSEAIKDFYYDTVIEFYTNDHGVELSKSLSKYYVKFYSNDPSFVFTFAHAMKKNDMFIDDLSPKMSKQALREKAKEKNPKDEVGYVKSIFFAYLLMRDYSLFEKIQYDTYAQPYDRNYLLTQIIDADQKILDRSDASEKIAKDKRIEKQKKASRSDELRKETNPINIATANKINKTKHINGSSIRNSKSNRIKRVKKI